MVRALNSIRKARPARLSLEQLEVRSCPAGLAGTLDPTFGIGGAVFLDMPGSGHEYAQAVAISQPDGNLIVAGRVEDFSLTSRPLITRYNPDGSLDASFGSSGQVVLSFGTYSSVANAVALQADGKIVVAGHSQSGTGSDFAVARLNTDGSLDTTFDGDGKVTVDFASGLEVANALALQADGRIIVVGVSYQASTGFDVALASLNTNGSLDTTFDSDGRAVVSFGPSNDFGNAVGVQSDGKIIVGGSTQVGTALADDFAVARLNGDGGLDTTFDADGRVTVNLGSSQERITGLAVQSDGKIVLGGYTETGTGYGYDFAAVRLNANGTLDGSFDVDAKVTIDFGSTSDGATSLALQSDGKILLAGSTYSSSTFNEDFAAVRLNGNGSLDSTFDGDGKVTVDFTSLNDVATGVALQADGKIVLAGQSHQAGNGYDVALARLNSGGSLDTTFSGDGKVLTSRAINGSTDYVQALAIQPNGKIVSLIQSHSTAGQRFFVVRQNQDGNPDTNFGTDGRVEINLGFYFRAANLAVSPDGKIVVVGQSYQFGHEEFVVARLNVNGSLDATFSGDGKATVDFGTSYESASAVALQADGKIVVAGYSYQGIANVDFAVARLNTDGSLDASFDSDGKLLVDFGAGDFAWAIAIAPNGKIVLAGSTYSPSTYDFAAARLNADGSLDSTFDGDGKVTVDFTSSYEEATGVSLQADGKVVLAGYSQQGSTGYDFAAARLNGDGSLDTGFSGDGKVTTDLGSLDDEAYGLAVQADGKVVLAGYAYPGDLGDVALVRYNANGSLDTTFNGTGKVLSDFGPDDGAQAMAVQPDGKIVVGGWSYQSGNSYDALIARYTVHPTGYAVVVGGQLLVYANGGNDTVEITSDGSGLITITLNGSVIGTFSAAEVTRFVVYGGDGDDDLQLAGNITTPAWLYGGGGNDRIKGGGGADVLLGGDGDDLLVGGGGRDLLIGGHGADRLVGNADDDILLAGVTTYESNAAAIDAIMAEWMSNRTYSQRVANISGQSIAGTDGSSFDSRQNGNYYLRTSGGAATVFDDNAFDLLTGGSGTDWFLFNGDGDNGSVKDKVTDLSASEFAGDLAWIQG